ncbi:MAG: GWxTD domain-containing protein [Candidatus Aminicenantes bacterium]|nr:MAG: GWxTD domain-containing protein [Candidatus Aminicenantes bacterium]
MKPKVNCQMAALGVVILVLFSTCCGPRGRVDLDPASKDFYEYARLIMTKPEKDIFLMLPDKKSREEFIEDFWAKRDPDAFTDENEFKQEFYARIEYVNKRFIEGIPGWKTDRGRIYIYLGPPDKIEQRPFINDPNVKGLIWWGYYKYRLGVEFIDKNGDGRYSLGRQLGAGGGLLDVIEKAKFGQIFDNTGDIGTVFSKFRMDYDRTAREIIVRIPIESLSFESAENKLLAVFDFEFFIYARKGTENTRFKRQRTYETTEKEVLELDEIILTFPHDLKPGEYYFDVVVIIKPKIGKVRKIFKIKV